MVGIPQDLLGSGRRMGKGSSSDWVIPSLMNMRRSSVDTGDIPLGLRVVCLSCWGKSYRSVSPVPPREVKVEDPSKPYRIDGVTSMSSIRRPLIWTSIYIVNLCESL